MNFININRIYQKRVTIIIVIIISMKFGCIQERERNEERKLSKLIDHTQEIFIFIIVGNFIFSQFVLVK